MTLDWVNSFVGVPYKINGRDRDGTDCWGMVVMVYREQRGIELPDWLFNGDDLLRVIKAINSTAAQAQDTGQAIQIDAAEEWAIAMVQRNNRANHVGVVVGGRVLHCGDKIRGTVCESLDRFLRVNPHCTFWRWVG